MLEFYHCFLSMLLKYTRFLSKCSNYIRKSLSLTGMFPQLWLSRVCRIFSSLANWSEVLVAQLHLTLWDPMYCSLPGSSVHGILQARILEWIAFPSPGDLPDPVIELRPPALQADSLPSELPGRPSLAKLWPIQKPEDWCIMYGTHLSNQVTIYVGTKTHAHFQTVINEFLLFVLTCLCLNGRHDNPRCASFFILYEDWGMALSLIYRDGWQNGENDPGQGMKDCRLSSGLEQIQIPESGPSTGETDMYRVLVMLGWIRWTHFISSSPLSNFILLS